MLYVQFTHSQRQEVLHQGLLNAWFFGASPEEIVVDNMLTAVTERCGRVVRLTTPSWIFCGPSRSPPVACNIRSPRKKRKNREKYPIYTPELLACENLYRSDGCAKSSQSVARYRRRPHPANHRRKTAGSVCRGYPQAITGRGCPIAGKRKRSWRTKICRDL